MHAVQSNATAKSRKNIATGRKNIVIKAIFLDIDGVLVIYRCTFYIKQQEIDFYLSGCFHVTHQLPFGGDVKRDCSSEFSPTAVAALDRCLCMHEYFIIYILDASTNKNNTHIQHSA